MMRRFIGLFGSLLCFGAGCGWVLAPQNNLAPQTDEPSSALLLNLKHSKLAIVPVFDEPFALSQASIQSPLSKSDEVIFQRIMKQAIDQNWYQRSISDVIQKLSARFLGTPYAEHLLDQSEQETLFTSLRQFDCVLFVETVLAMARGIVNNDDSPATFAKHLQEQRYENGTIDGYCSRLHYFSYWIEDNQRRGIVTDITASLGGVPLNKTLNFMSTHWRNYPKLVKSETEHRCIERMEAKLNSRQIDYIPTARIRQVYDRLQPGDIVAIATRIPGLDVTHTGLVYRSSNGEMGLIHAAPGSGVKISADLQTYVSRVEDAIGILVARPAERRSHFSREL